MSFREVSDTPEQFEGQSFDRSGLENRLKQAEDVRPGTFRYSDAGLSGEVRTSSENLGSVQSLAKAEVFRRDGTSDVVGTARYSVAGSEARLYSGSMNAQTHGVESALLDEIGQQARAQGTDRLSVWVPDNDTVAAARWSRHGFQSLERDPDAAGVTWEKRL